MWDFDQPYFEGKLIAADDAWRRFDDWRASRAEIGVLFVSKSATLSTIGTVQSVRNGTLRIQGTAAGTRFDLKDARFTYGPTQFFPRWPMGPMLELMAVSVCLPAGEWLVLAEGMKPEAMMPRAIE